MIDKEFTKETGIEIETLDTNKDKDRTTYIIKAVYKTGKISDVCITHCNHDEYDMLSGKIDNINNYLSNIRGFVYIIRPINEWSANIAISHI